jgi:tetratricopeptide (TPR) repeat protein
MGDCLLRLDSLDQALPVLSEARGLCEDSKPDNVHDWCTARSHHADACLGFARLYFRRDPNRAQEWYELAVKSLEESLSKKPYTTTPRRKLSQVYFELGKYYVGLGRRKEALAAFQAAVDHRQRVLAQNPANQGDRRRMETIRKYTSHLQSEPAL